MEDRKLLNQAVSPVWWIILGVVARLLPHTPNLTPIGAVALFAGVSMNKKMALILPIGAMVISDLVIGFDSWPMRICVYGSILLVSLLGMLLKNRLNVFSLVLTSLGGSVLFFVITNWGVWQFGSLYSDNLSGLMESYFMGIPFFRNMVIGDLVYNGIFFGSFEMARQWQKKEAAISC